MAGDPRHTRLWRELTARMRKRWPEPVCAECHEVIDISLPKGDDKAWQLDHIVPLHQGGAPYDVDNLRPIHAVCNRRKGGGASGFGEAKAKGSKGKWG